MSNPITEARSDVAAALGGIEGVKVFPYIPEAMSAPAAIVTPGSPYVVPGTAMGDFEVTLNVRLFAKAGTNEVISESLDTLIVSVCEALSEFGIWIVERPGVDSESYSNPYLVTDITVKTFYRKDGS